MLAKKLCLLLMLVLSVGHLVGCSGGGKGGPQPEGDEIVSNPVEGQIMMANRSPFRCEIMFYREDVTDPEAPISRGACDEQGYFQMSTSRAGDGVPPGKYKVLLRMSAIPAQGGARPSPVDALGGAYMDMSNPQFTVEVPKGGKTDISWNVTALTKEEVDALLAADSGVGKPGGGRSEQGKDAE